MSDFFARLIQAAYRPDARMRPRPAAHFEQTPTAPPFEPELFGGESVAPATEIDASSARRIRGRPSVGAQPASAPEADALPLRAAEAPREARFDATSPTRRRAPVAQGASSRGHDVRTGPSPGETILKAGSTTALQATPAFSTGQDAHRSRLLPSSGSPISESAHRQVRRLHPQSDAAESAAPTDGLSGPAEKAARASAPSVARRSLAFVRKPFAGSTDAAPGDFDDLRRPIASQAQRRAGVPAALPSAPAQASPEAAPAAQPVIRVTIGRIVMKAEVRSAPSSARPQPSRPALSLTDYLNARNGGGA